MYENYTAACGCIVEINAYAYEEGCCEMCVSTAVEIESVVIIETCEKH